MNYLTAILEWLAFGSAMLCVFLYGYSKARGAMVGLVTAALFITWGLTAEVYAAAVTNVFFLCLHGNNLRRAYNDD